MPATPSNLSDYREQVVSLPPFHAVIFFLINALGGYLQVQYQSRKLSPLDEHGNIMRAIYGFLSMYAVGLMAEFELQIPIISRFTPLIGILVAVLLLIILFPLLGLVAFIMWALYFMGAVIRSLCEIFSWFRHVYSLGNEENDSTVPVRENTDLPVEVELATEEISNI